MATQALKGTRSSRTTREKVGVCRKAAEMAATRKYRTWRVTTDNNAMSLPETHRGASKFLKKFKFLFINILGKVCNKSYRAT